MSTGTGVDGCRGGWLVVQFDGRHAQAQLVATVADIPLPQPTASIWIDMPIGLIDSGSNGRECDRLARRILSPLRHSSVFTPPCRAAVYAPQDAASTINAQYTGKKLSLQSLNILPKIRALDAHLQSLQPAVQQAWYEAHPEVVFAALQELHPLPHNKKTAQGRQQRHQLLRSYFSDIDTWFQKMRARFPASRVATDDIYDALALAIGSYRVSSGQATLTSLPATPPSDRTGLPMRIVYAADRTAS